MNRKILFFVIIVILIGFVSAFFIYLNPKKKTAETPQVQTDEIREIIISASRFEYNPSVVSVKKGERIKLIVNNADTLHGIIIPELGIRGNNFVEFVAEKAGEFTWYCNNFCGQLHRQMQGKLIIED